MKGFGGFILVMVLLATAMCAYLLSAKNSDNERGAINAGQMKANRLSVLSMAIRESYAHSSPDERNSWKQMVEGQLAETYGVSIVVDGATAIIHDERDGIQTTVEFA